MRFERNDREIRSICGVKHSDKVSMDSLRKTFAITQIKTLLRSTRLRCSGMLPVVMARLFKCGRETGVMPFRMT